MVIEAKDGRGEILRYEDSKVITKGLTLEDVKKFVMLEEKVEQRVREIQAQEQQKHRREAPELEM